MFTRSALSSAITLAMAIASQPLLAQDQPAPATGDEVEEIVVSGIKESLTKALEIKKENIQIVDSVVAEDIGKFPDNNLVESLQRVTGVQTTNRGSGEVSGITIRGLPDVETTINGREIFTGIGRTLALQDIPANLLNRVDVFKTRSANQIEGGMAGSIDVRTNRPFDFDGSKVAISAKGTYQTTSEKYDPNVSALFSNKWDTSIGEVGALLNVSTVTTHYRDQSASVGALFPMFTQNFIDSNGTSYKVGDQIPITDAAKNRVWIQGTVGGLPDKAGSTLTMNGQSIDYILERDAMFLSDFQGTRERPAANLSLQWAPNDSSEYVFETFYTGYRNQSENRLLFTFINGPSKFQETELYPDTNVVHKVYVNNPTGFSSGDGSEGQTDSIMYALGGKWDISDNFKVKADLNHQISNYETRFVANQWSFSRYQAIADYNYHNNNTIMLAFLDDPTTSFDESDMTQLGNAKFSNFYDNADKQHGEGTTLTIDGEYDANWGVITKTRFGLRVDERKADSLHRDKTVSSCAGNASCDISLHPELIDISRKGFFDGYGYVPSQWFAANGTELIDHTDTYRALFGIKAGGEDWLPASSFNVKELNTALYAEADFETELGDKKVDGNFGLRAVQIKNTSEFYTGTSETTDTRVLPSFGIRYWLEDDLVARFNFGQTLRRPGFGDLNPAISYAEPNTTPYGTAGSGNPNLKATESKNYDLGLEWYFAESSSLYGVLFERDVKGFVLSTQSVISGPTEGLDYVYTKPDNSSEGWLKGAEIGLVYFPTNLPSYLDGLGGQFSYTMLDSNQTNPSSYDVNGNLVPVPDSPLFGVSDSSYSAVLAYEKHGFSARLSYVWREKFLQRNDGTLFASPLQIYSAPEESLDLQLSYNLTDNWVVTLDGTNLTNYRFRTYYHSITNNNPDYLMNYGTALLSKTVSLGTRISF